jgi:aromatic ring-opening dioxygenase catalytic subunit (LigB family)
MQQHRLPSFFLCHGGGPWPWMDGPFREMFSGLERSLQAVPAQLPQRPAAILMVSAHWEEAVFTVTAAQQPPMIYDYAGFPPETYAIRYPSPGSPALADCVVSLLRSAGLPAQPSLSRGYDHGTYSVLQPMFPQADIPVVQLSLRASLDPAEHLRAGAALASLRDENVLIIGSGMSSHGARAEMGVASPRFDEWLRQTLQMRGEARQQALAAWAGAPHARTVHPREEHLIPLLVAAGAARDEAASPVHGERLLGEVAISSFRFGQAAGSAS